MPRPANVNITNIAKPSYGRTQTRAQQLTGLKRTLAELEAGNSCGSNQPEEAAERIRQKIASLEAKGVREVGKL